MTDSATGNSIASFLLGDMSAAQATINAAPYLVWRYPVVFFQDDWKVTRRLTVNLGLRWDEEMPVQERYNRQVRGFDFTRQEPHHGAGIQSDGRTSVRRSQRAAARRLQPDQERLAAARRTGVPVLRTRSRWSSAAASAAITCPPTSSAARSASRA